MTLNPSNLPPGCSNSDIERAAGAFDETPLIDLLYRMGTRVRKLGDMKLKDLRSSAGYDSPNEALRRNKYRSRGSLIEEIIIEEFEDEFQSVQDKGVRQ